MRLDSRESSDSSEWQRAPFRQCRNLRSLPMVAWDIHAFRRGRNLRSARDKRGPSSLRSSGQISSSEIWLTRAPGFFHKYTF